MNRRAWGSGAVVALAWGCNGQVTVGRLAGSTTGGPSGSMQGTAPSNVTTYSAFGATMAIPSPCGNRCLCLPYAEPRDSAGQVPCQLFFSLQAGDTCSANSLLAAAPDVLASVSRAAGAMPGELCVVPQIPSSQWVNGSCLGSSIGGWCYVADAAAGNCAQRIATSVVTPFPAGVIELYACGGSVTAEEPVAASPAQVGVACVPSSESLPAFGGFDYKEVSLDEKNPACAGDVCLVNHFQGLTSCPYGQAQDGTPMSPGGSSCTVPGTSTPVRPDAGVPGPGQTVDPWCLDRTPSDTVYCSCRCENAEGKIDDGASYCACPTGFTCSQVVPALVSGDPRAGGYCIMKNTGYDPSNVCMSECTQSAQGFGNCTK